jgi:hypothetical protein
MKYFYGLLLLVFFFPFSSRGQSNYQKGYVVTLAGDTLRGLINVREWTQNPQTIAFRKSETDLDYQEFSPQTSRYFEIPGQVAYQSFSGRISMDPTDFNKLLSQADTSKATVTIYLQVIHSGQHVRLLAYQDDIKIRFFLQEQHGMPQELGYRAYLDPKGNQVRTHKFYTGQLWLAAQKFGMSSPALQARLSSAEYRKSDLEAIVGRINGLDDRQMKTLREKRGGLRFFAGTGLTRNVYTVTGKHELASNTTYGAAYRPKISAGADFFLNAEVQRFFFRGQLTLLEAEADIFMKKEDFLVDEGHLTFKQQTISVLPQAVYNLYNTPKLQFNVGLGLGVNFSAYSDNIYRVKTYVRSDGTIASGSTKRNEFKLQSPWLSFPLRAGILLGQRLDVSLLHFVPVPISSPGEGINYTGTHLEVNYLFN